MKCSIKCLEAEKHSASIFLYTKMLQLLYCGKHTLKLCLPGISVPAIILDMLCLEVFLSICVKLLRQNEARCCLYKHCLHG